MAPRRVAGAGLFLLGLLVGLGPAAAQETEGAAMTSLVAVMRARDAEGFLALLPASGVLAITGTIEKRRVSNRVPVATVRSDLKARTGTYETLFGDRGDDSWRDIFELT